MAQTKRKRRRKHKGTQGGRISDRPRGRPRSREEARARARSGKGRGKGKGRQAAGARGARPATWGGAVLKGSVAALLFFVLIGLVLRRPLAGTAVLSVAMLIFYIPMTYVFDSYFYQRRLRQIERQKLEKAQRRAGGGGEG
jgi:hypothetical protein